MAFFQLMMNAWRLEAARQEYHDEKLKSIEMSKGKEAHYTFSQKIRLKKIMFKIKAKELLNKCTSLPEDSWLHQKSVLLRTDGTFENFLLKSLIGFLGGIVLTYMFFMFFVFQLNFALSSATLLCSIFGIILTIGLAFSDRVRCIVFLLLPQFFSKRGRQALMAYAFILALTGPAKNTLHNIGVLSESLACGQEQLKEAVKTIVDMVKQPFYALRDAIAKVIKIVQTVVQKLKEALLAIKRMVLSILKVITAVFDWLGSIVNICNKKLGTPFERCEKVFEGAVTDCQAKLGPFFGKVCSLAYVVGQLCYVVKPYDFICMLVSFVADTIVGSVRKKIKKFSNHVKAMFYVKVNFSHSFKFETNSSRTLEDVANEIVSEIRARTDKFLTLFDYMSFAASFFVLFMLLRVIHYRHKWLTNERFDNQYLTSYLRDIDLIRARNEQDTVLPLNPRERNKYIPLTSITLIKVEKVHLTKSVIFLGLATFKLCIHMMVDYSLYWVLSTIRYHGRFETKVQQMNSVGIFVSGDGYLAQLYRSVVRAFSPSDADIEIDSLPCLPDPVSPDLDRYTQIMSLIFFCWALAIFEPYGLRLRQVVMAHYHPDRAKQRAVWLYNHILRSRGSFLKYARRQLRRKFGFKSDKNSENVTMKEHIMAICPILHKCFHQEERMCLLCGAPERESPHVKCPTPGCIGIFCIQCFADLLNLCTICKAPMDYGDLSDMSEERDSSDDQVSQRIHHRPKEKKNQLTEEEDEGIGDTERTPTTTEGIYDTENVNKDESVFLTEENEEQSESSSAYSQSYQDETQSHEISPLEQSISNRDIEAQRVRDDVTIQIFNEPLRRDATSSSGSPTGCFVVRARRKLCSRIKPSKCPCRRKSSSSTSKSISDTDSNISQEIEEDEVIHVEIGDELEGTALLGAGGSDILRKKPGKVHKIMDALNRVSWLRKKSSKTSGVRQRPSLTQKVVDMLQSEIPETSNERIVTHRQESFSDGEQLVRYLSSSSSSCDEISCRYPKRSKSYPYIEKKCNRNIYSFNWDSHRQRGELGNRNHIGFLNELANKVKYFEINERTDENHEEKNNQSSENEYETTIGETSQNDDDSQVNKSTSQAASSWYNCKNFGTEMSGLKKKFKKKMKSIKKDLNKKTRPYLPIPEKKNPVENLNEEVVTDEKSEYKESSPEAQMDSLLKQTTDSPDFTSESLPTSPIQSHSHRSSSKKSSSPAVYREYRKKYRKKRKCRRCHKSREAYTESNKKSEEVKLDEEPGQRVTGFRPIIYPVPCCHGPQTYIPSIGLDREEWFQSSPRKFSSPSQCKTQETKFTSTTDISMCNQDETNFPSTSNAQSTRKYNIPVLRRFLPMFQRSDIIEELKEHDRKRLLEERADKRRVSESTQTKEESLGRKKLMDSATCGFNTMSRPSKIPKGGEALPYQGTETFQHLVEEYKQVTHPEIPVNESYMRNEPHLIEMRKSADESDEIIQLFPKTDRKQSGAFLEMANSFVSVLKQRKGRQKTSDISSSEIESQRLTTGTSTSEDEAIN